MSKSKEIRLLDDRLDYYTMEAEDDQFDAEEVIRLLQRKRPGFQERSILDLCQYLGHKKLNTFLPNYISENVFQADKASSSTC